MPGGEFAPSDATRHPYLRPELGSAADVFPSDKIRPSTRDARHRRALVAADVVALAATYALLRFVIAPDQTPTDAVVVAAIPLGVVLNKILRLYDRGINLIHKSTLNELPTIVQSSLLNVALMFMLAPSTATAANRHGWLIEFWLVASALVVCARSAARAIVSHVSEHERVVVIGSGIVATLIAHRLEAHPEYGIEMAGYVDLDDAAGSTNVGDLPRLGGVRDFQAICREHGIERVVVAFSSLAHESLLDIVRVSKRMKLKISIVPRLFEVVGHSVEFDQIEGLTLLTLRGQGRTPGALALKRAVDIVGASVLLILTAPLMLVVAIVVKLTSPGPVLFVQSRTGRGNRPFKMLKVRTMVDGADAMKDEVRHLNELADRRMFKITDDPRVTAPGRFLRRTSLDELPQLVNVLRGEMSLVGPRPLVPEETDLILGWHRARLDLTPGLTGPWQVMGRNVIPFEEMVKIDYLYVADWSLWNDIKLLLRTLPVVFRRHGR